MTEGTSGAAEFIAAKLYVHVVVEVIALIGPESGDHRRGVSKSTFPANFTGVKGELRESFSNGNTIVSGDVNGDGLVL